MTAEVLTMPEPETLPIAEIPPGERLGTLVKRYRLAVDKTTTQVADHLDLPEAVVVNVESFRSPLKTEQLQELASFLNVRFEPFLDAARDFHRAIWQKNNNEPGVQLAEMTSKVGSVGENVTELEQTAVDVVISVAHTVQILRTLGRRLLETEEKAARDIFRHGDAMLGQAKRLQDVLVARGVIQEPVTHPGMNKETSEENGPQVVSQVRCGHAECELAGECSGHEATPNPDFEAS